MQTGQQPADSTLISRFLARRDEAVFRELYRRHAPALYRFVVLRVGAESADDVAQETWLRAMRRLATYRGTAAFRTWLTGIALNVSRENWGRLRQIGLVEEGLVASPHSRSAVQASGERTDLVAAVKQLTEATREVWLLHDVEGYTHAEIASFLGIAPGTSKSQLHKARRAMRALLSSEGKKDD